MNTVAHGRLYIADAVKGGSSPDSPYVLKVMNRAQEALLSNQDLVDLTKKRMRFSVPPERNMIACPSCVERVVAYKADGVPGVVPKSIFYEFLPGGSWSSDEIGGYKTDMVDMDDHHPTMFELDYEYTDMKLYAFGSNAADVGKTIFVDGLNSQGWHPVDADGEYGEEITIAGGLQSDGTIDANQSDLKPSTFSFKEILNVVKPVTKGYVALMCQYSSEYYWFNLSMYEPKETNPSYHRYKVTLPRSDEGVCITALVHVRHVPLINDTDVLLIQNLEALKNQVMADQYEQASPVLSERFAAKAISLLRRDVAHKTPDTDFSMSDTCAVGTILSM